MSDWIETPDMPVGETAAPPTPTPTVAAPAPAPAPTEDATETDADDDAVEGEQESSERDSKGRWRPRAKSQQARAEDVPRIRELTKKLRTVEHELQTLKAPKPQAPEPVFQLPTPPAPFKGEDAPTIEQFAAEDDPYGAWLLAKMEWKQQQNQQKADAGKQQDQFAQTTKQAEAYWAGVFDQHKQRLTALVASNPSAAATLQSVTIQPPPVLDRAIMLDPDSATVALFLASHPAQLDELALLTASQPVTQQNVEIIRRRLHQMMSAAPSGSATSSPAFVPAPRPPNPLRTAPMTTGDHPPGDDDSLEAHERYYGQRARRRR